MRTSAYLLFLLCLTSKGLFAELPVTCWDAASEYNDSALPDKANPSGVWSYGWKKKFTGKFFFALTAFTDPPNLSGWCSASGLPVISHSLRTIPLLMSGPNQILVPPRALQLHPGPEGEYAVLRFTAPVDGAYRVSGQFSALDDNGSGTTTDVWVVPNDDKTAAYSSTIDFKAGHISASFTSRSFQLKKGDTIDFEVGYGPGKDYQFDSTGLKALIEKIK